jgi:hypothetical protein
LPPDATRRLVIDEDMNWKLTLELRQRGFRDAASNRQLDLLGLKDGQLIKRLATEHEPCVLVVWDNKLPESHRRELDHFKLTVAVIDKRRGRDGKMPAERLGLTEEEYYRAVIHRHAHQMARQLPGSIYRYRFGNRMRLR